MRRQHLVKLGQWRPAPDRPTLHRHCALTVTALVAATAGTTPTACALARTTLALHAATLAAPTLAITSTAVSSATAAEFRASVALAAAP